MKVSVATQSVSTIRSRNDSTKRNIGVLYSTPYSTTPTDCFIKNISFGNNYNHDEALKVINKIENDSVTDSGSGFQSKFYKVNDSVGIKAPSPKTPDALTGNVYGHNNIKEYFALKKIEQIDSEIAPIVYDLIEQNGKSYLVIDIIKGKHPIDTALTKEYLENIVGKSFKLDINGMAQCDLQPANIFLQDNSKVKFIDFGSFYFLDNDGNYRSSDETNFEYFKNNQITNKTNMDSKEKFIRTFFNHNPKTDLNNCSDNPYLNIKSNISNFEFRTIYDYLMSNKTDDKIGLFKDYLKAKSDIYHANMIEFLSSLNINDDTKKHQLEQAIEQEKIFKEVFANPSENVLKTELAKIQLKWLINDYQDGQKYLPEIFEKLLQSTKEYQNKAEGLEKTYFDSMLSNFKFFENIGGFSAQSDKLKLPDDKNILKVIFDVKTTITGGATQVLETAKKSNAKYYAIGAIVAGLTGLGIVFAKTKTKNSNKINVGSQNNNSANTEKSTNSFNKPAFNKVA